MDYNIYGGDKINIYKEMYYSLFNKVTNAIEVLKASQQAVEEMHISNFNESENPDKEEI